MLRAELFAWSAAVPFNNERHQQSQLRLQLKLLMRIRIGRAELHFL